ncbi:MAG: glycosyltransferase family 8 protein [Bacteroidales bacterium]|nr:glycosyltransferase family 8 protein [Bacteroidales bacterium]
MSHRLHVACCCDDNYLPHTAATLTSVIAHHPRGEVVVHLVAQQMSEANLSLIRQHCEAMGAGFHFYAITEAESQRFHVTSDPNRLSKAAYYRIFLPQLLSSEVKRVLYLDGDTIVRRNLRPFYDMDLDGWAAAVVRDINDDADYRAGYLGYEASLGYFNSGVLLLNLDYWREHRLIEECIDYFQQHHTHIIYDDQDVLNAVLAGRAKYVSLIYNAQSLCYRIKFATLAGLDDPQLREELKDPAIVHFTSIDKPWAYRCLLPHRHDYFRYLAMTPWKHTSARKTWRWCLKHYLRKWSIDLGLGRRQFVRL